MWKITSLVIALFLISGNEAATGMDISSYGCSSIDWSCLASNGYSFAIIEVWTGGYGANQNIGSCVSAAWNAGFKHVDVYAYMCMNCQTNNPPSEAISAIGNVLSGVDFGMLWIDIEQCSGCWSDDDNQNCDYVAEAASSASNAGYNVGMYSSEGEWGMTVGEDCTAVSNYPLWYAHYDDDDSFSDGAYNFGGWSSPAMKQYSGDVTVCGNEIDQDWYPDSYDNMSIRERYAAMLNDSRSARTVRVRADQ